MEVRVKELDGTDEVVICDGRGLTMEWRHRHVLDLDSWDRSVLQHILEQTRSYGRTS